MTTTDPRSETAERETPPGAEAGLTVVVPVFDEAKAASRLAARLEGVRSRCAFPIEFILVDDGSTDGTREVLAGLPEGRFRVIRHSRNRGYGASLKSGVRAARYAWVAITDADETYPDERLPELFQRAVSEELDMVVGARTGTSVRIPLVRRPPKWLLNKLANGLSGCDIPDLNSGLRVMRRSLVSPLFRVLPDGFSFTTTITLAMLSNGQRVVFVPIDYHARAGRSKIRPIRDTLNFLQLICRTVLWFNPLRVFIPLSLSLMLCSVAVLVVSKALTGHAMDVTFAVIFMSGVMVLAIGLLADLVDKRIG